MSDVKRIDLTEFREKGFLQEVNRKFFHPLGLALEVIMEEDGTVSSIGGVWDYRDDPEGMFFGEDMIKQEKIDYVEELRVSKIAARRAASKKYPIFVNDSGMQTYCTKCDVADL